MTLFALSPGCARQDGTQFVWSGGITPGSATVKVGLSPADAAGATLLVRPSGSPGPPAIVFAPSHITAGTATFPAVLTFDLAPLTPATHYTYTPAINGTPVAELEGRLQTFPPSGKPASFTVAFASCARTGSRHAVFTAIRNLHPLFFLHMGDLHYENIKRNDRDKFRRAFGRVLRSPTQAALYRKVPFAYVWDDHDYGKNNADSTSPARAAARLTYREYVPHYPLPGEGDAPIYQAFSVGRVRFILTDLRSERTATSMLGADQKKWLFDELLNSAKDHALLVWVSTVTWTGEPEPGSDRWAGYADERREIANFVKSHGIAGLCILSGDAHMLAIDNGEHTGFADGGGPAIPLFQAAALDQLGSVKTRGRPFTYGPIPGGGHFGLMTVTDDGGDHITVRWSGRGANNTELMSHQFHVADDGH